MRRLRSLGLGNLALGTLGAAAAVGTGLWAERTVGHSDAAHAIMETHKLLGLGVLAAGTALTVWRWRAAKEPAGMLRAGYFALAALLLGLVAATGHVGGRLVFENGVGMRPGVVPPQPESAGGMATATTIPPAMGIRRRPAKGPPGRLERLPPQGLARAPAHAPAAAQPRRDTARDPVHRPRVGTVRITCIDGQERWPP